jgi:phosphatidylglycerophosphate synthase
LFEHKLHTARSFLFAPLVFLLFYAEFSGLLLWLAVALIGIDLIIEMIDVVSERDSRADLGGLTSAEYAAHVAATVFRVAALILALAAKSPSAWEMTSSVAAGEVSFYSKMIAINVINGNLIVAFLHCLLMSSKFRSMSIFSCCNLSKSS